VPQMSLPKLSSLSTLSFSVTFDDRGNACTKLLCLSCSNHVTDGLDAVVQVIPNVRLACGRCMSNLDDRAQVVGLADFLIALVRNAGLGGLLRADVDAELLPVLTE